MPYIKLEDRPKFENSIRDVLETMHSETDTLYSKGEYFGYFVNRLCRKFIGNPNYTSESFNSSSFSEGKKKVLTNQADKVGAMLDRSDPIAAAGQMNYVISAILWGFLGDCKHFPTAGYGVRSYFTGIIEKVYSTLDATYPGSNRDATMAFRRMLITRGVLHDVLSEVYRRRTEVYEDQKILENKDLWENGVLVQ